MSMILALFVACLCMHCHAAANCANPIVPDSWQSWMLTTPEPLAATALCPTLTSSCCPTGRANEINQVFTQIRGEVDSLRSHVASAFDSAQVDEVIASALANSNLPDAVHDDFAQFIRSVFGSARSVSNTFVNDVISCLHAQLRFVAGGICLVCDAEWDRYITVDSDATVTLKFADSVCNTVGGECGQVIVTAIDGAVTMCNEVYDNAGVFITKLFNFKLNEAGANVQAINALKSLFDQALADRTACARANFAAEAPCQDAASCKTYVCDELGGFESEPFDDSAVDLFVAGFEKAFDNFPSMGAKRADDDAADFAAVVAALKTVLTPVAQTRSVVRAALQSTVISPSYGAGGYDAIAAGDRSTFDTELASSAPSSLQHVAAAVLAAVA